MPKKKSEPTPPPIDIARYRRPARYRDFAYSEMPGLEEGQEPLRITVQSNLSFGQLDAIPYGKGTPYVDVFQAIAPYITAWNVEREVMETGELEPVPPPSEAGWEVLQVLDHIEAHWVMDKVKFGYLAVVEDAEAAAGKMRQLITDAKERASRQSEPTGGPSRGDDAATA
jgi:hypothetical protein